MGPRSVSGEAEGTVLLGQSRHGRGRGLFAARDIRNRELLIIEDPLVEETHDMITGGRKEISRSWANNYSSALRQDIRARWPQLARVPSTDLRPKHRAALNKWMSENGFAAERQRGRIYRVVCMVNHACRPNCSFCQIKGRARITAVRDIAKGEEITINYGRKLGFSCSCDDCQYDVRRVMSAMARPFKRLAAKLSGPSTGPRPVDEKSDKADTTKEEDGAREWYYSCLRVPLIQTFRSRLSAR